MKWIYLFIAGALEITWAVTMKMSNCFTVLIPSIITGVGYIASAVFLSIALRQLPLGTAYAMWTGMILMHCGRMAKLPSGRRKSWTCMLRNSWTGNISPMN